jgi:hypothetical protein
MIYFSKFCMFRLLCERNLSLLSLIKSVFMTNKAGPIRSKIGTGSFLSGRISELQVDVYRNFGWPLTDEKLCEWHHTRITGCSAATATRDLVKLVEMGAMTRTGELKNARYFLKLD